jgi:predicted acyltransferase
MKDQTTQRFLALDVFRGMTICFMIIVNTPGNGGTTYPLLQHAHWHGFTPTDLVFPSFLFAVGNALSFVMLKWNNKPQSEVLLKIFKRTAIIFLLGYLMYWFPFFRLDAQRNIISFPISETRIFGVLQRIALCYGIAALLIYYFKPKVAVIVSILFLLAYWFVMMSFGDANDPLSMLGNVGQKIDLWLMGDKHLYHGEGVAFDPEGLLSTLPAIGNVVAGYVVGQFVQKNGKTYEGLSKLLLAGFALFVIAYLWNTVFPINKKLWTSSFVLLTVGLDCMILSAIIYVVDFLHKTSGTHFFEVPGKNPLIVYLFSELLVTVLYMTRIDKTSTYEWFYQNIFIYADNYFGSFLFAITYMLVCWSLGYILDKKRIYIKV